MDSFVGDGQLQLGVSASLAIGPFGRDIAASIGVGDSGNAAPSVSWSTAQGAYVGGVIDGTAWKVNKEDITAFYGTSVTPKDIFAGQNSAAVPQSAQQLVGALESLVAVA